GRSLLNPDEVLNLGKDVAIAIQPDGHPHFLRPVDYWTLGEAFDHLRKTQPSLYWKPPLTYDENPYFSAPSPEEIVDADAGRDSRKGRMGRWFGARKREARMRQAQ